MNTTIHTIEDLIRILDDNPEWTDALRAPSWRLCAIQGDQAE